MWKVNVVAALMYRIIDIGLGDFGMFCRDGYLFLELYLSSSYPVLVFMVLRLSRTPG